MKAGLRLNEWVCVHLKAERSHKDAYWINRVGRLNLGFSSCVSRDLTHLLDGLQAVFLFFVLLFFSSPSFATFSNHS